MGDMWIKGGEMMMMIRGYFCDGTRRNTVPKVSLGRTQAGTAFWNFFPPGIAVTNTTPLRPSSGSHLTFRNLF
jgi:hypothetical protein